MGNGVSIIDGPESWPDGKWTVDEGLDMSLLMARGNIFFLELDQSASNGGKICNCYDNQSLGIWTPNHTSASLRRDSSG